MSTSAGDSSTIYQRPVELLQNLIRFDTTNPPGNEEECIKYIDTLLQSAGIQTTIVAQSANRPNLIARFQGRGVLVTSRPNTTIFRFSFNPTVI